MPTAKQSPQAQRPKPRTSNSVAWKWPRFVSLEDAEERSHLWDIPNALPNPSKVSGTMKGKAADVQSAGANNQAESGSSDIPKTERPPLGSEMTSPSEPDTTLKAATEDKETVQGGTCQVADANTLYRSSGASISNEQSPRNAPNDVEWKAPIEDAQTKQAAEDPAEPNPNTASDEHQPRTDSDDSSPETVPDQNHPEHGLDEATPVATLKRPQLGNDSNEPLPGTAPNQRRPDAPSSELRRDENRHKLEPVIDDQETRRQSIVPVIHIQKPSRDPSEAGHGEPQPSAPQIQAAAGEPQGEVELVAQTGENGVTNLVALVPTPTDGLPSVEGPGLRFKKRQRVVRKSRNILARKAFLKAGLGRQLALPVKEALRRSAKGEQLVGLSLGVPAKDPPAQPPVQPPVQQPSGDHIA